MLYHKDRIWSFIYYLHNLSTVKLNELIVSLLYKSKEIVLEFRFLYGPFTYNYT